MPKMVYLMEGEAFPPKSSGFFVSRDKAGSDCTWGAVVDYARTPALPHPILECQWDAAIFQASRVARTLGETLYVVRG